MIKKGDLVILFSERRNYLVEVTDKLFHTDKGYIDLKELEQKNWGEKVLTNKGEVFYILKPTLEDLIMKGVKRFTQIIYPKDAGLIIVKSGINSESKVIEVGTGAGAFTIALANFLKPKGKLISYEKRKEFYELAKKNLEKAGVLNFVKLKNKEIKDRFDEKDADFIFLDLPTPWELIEAVYKALKPGFRCAGILPTVNQTEKFVISLKEKGFVNIETIEVLVRRILVREGKTRPEQQMPSHTGYLIFATKTI